MLPKSNNISPGGFSLNLQILTWLLSQLIFLVHWTKWIYFKTNEFSLAAVRIGTFLICMELPSLQISSFWTCREAGLCRPRDHHAVIGSRVFNADVQHKQPWCRFYAGNVQMLSEPTAHLQQCQTWLISDISWVGMSSCKENICLGFLPNHYFPLRLISFTHSDFLDNPDDVTIKLLHSILSPCCSSAFLMTFWGLHLPLPGSECSCRVSQPA